MIETEASTWVVSGILRYQLLDWLWSCWLVLKLHQNLAVCQKFSVQAHVSSLQVILFLLLGTVHYFHRSGAGMDGSWFFWWAEMGGGPELFWWDEGGSSVCFFFLFFFCSSEFLCLSFPQFKMEWRPCIIVRKGGEWEGCGPFPHFWWQSGEMSHSGDQLLEVWNLWWKWYKLRIHYEIMWILPLETGFSWTFKTLKPMSFRRLHPLDPRYHNGISNENSTNWQFSAKSHVNFAPPPHLTL